MDARSSEAMLDAGPGTPDAVASGEGQRAPLLPEPVTAKSEATSAPSGPLDGGSVEILSQGYLGGGRRCFRVKAFGAYEHDGVAEFDSPAQVRWWRLATAGPERRVAHFAGSLQALRRAAGTSEISPHALALALSFLDPAATARENLRFVADSAAPGPLKYEGDSVMPGTNRHVRIEFRQDRASLRVVGFYYVTSGGLSSGQQAVLFQDEAALRPGDTCPFPKPATPP
jgi:hypothetical protein